MPGQERNWEVGEVGELGEATSQAMSRFSRTAETPGGAELCSEGEVTEGLVVTALAVPVSGMSPSPGC